jgi:chorismate synthase
MFAKTGASCLYQYKLVGGCAGGPKAMEPLHSQAQMKPMTKMTKAQRTLKQMGELR